MRIEHITWFKTYLRSTSPVRIVAASLSASVRRAPVAGGFLGGAGGEERLFEWWDVFLAMARPPPLSGGHVLASSRTSVPLRAVVNELEVFLGIRNLEEDTWK